MGAKYHLVADKYETNVIYSLQFEQKKSSSLPPKNKNKIKNQVKAY